RRRFLPSWRFTWVLPPFWVLFPSIRHSFHWACSASIGTSRRRPIVSTSIRYCSFVAGRERTSITPIPSFGSRTTRPSPRTPREPRIARASRAVSVPFVESTPMIFPFRPRNFPRAMNTSSPFRSGTALGIFQSCFFRSAGSTCAARLRCRCCQFASAFLSRCFRGSALTIVGTSHDHARRRGDPGPPLRGFPRDGALDVGALRLPLRRREDARVVLEPYPRAVGPSERAALPHDHRVHDLLPHLRAPLLHGDDEEISDPRGGPPLADALVRLHGDDLDDLRPRVVDAVQAGARLEPPRLVAREALHGPAPWVWMTTNETVLLSGRHSIRVTTWPGWRSRHSGACASIRRVRFSYRSY